MRLKSIGVFLISLVFLISWVSAYSVSSLVLTVYSDGYVKVNYEIAPADYESQIQLPLLGKHDEDFIVEDENGNPLNFQVENGSLLIYTEGAKLINVSYYTPDLTSKQGIVWTLHICTNSSFTVVLPDNSIVVDLSDIPLEIAGNSITMPPGNQSISYTITGHGSVNAESSRWPYFIILVATISILSVAYALYVRKRSLSTKNLPTREEFKRRIANLELTEEERQALLYIFDKGGRASQAEVREAIGIPKTTAWRMFKRLERKGLLKILRGRKENWVELRF